MPPIMIRLAPLFHDLAVLQRDMPIPVWGTAAAGDAVKVTLAGVAAQVIAGPEGRWLVRLPPLPAGGPYELVAALADGSDQRAVAREVLIGEVWLCSGQSNMEWKLAQVDPEAGVSADSELPQVRLLAVGNQAGLGRQDGIAGTWQVCSARSLASFSAVAGWFGRTLHRDLAVPVGLICNAWGGTRVQTWMSREALMQDPYGRDDVRHYEGYVHAAAGLAPGEYVSLADWERRGAPQDTGNRGLAEGWAAADFDDATWPVMPVPSRWQQQGHPGSGVLWFRRSVAIPSAWAGRDLELRLGSIDKHDDTWVAGERVGGLSWDAGPNSWCTPRVYTVPGRLVRADGLLHVAVRARSHAFDGGMIGPGVELRVAPVGEPEPAVSLAGPWRWRVEQDWGAVSVPGFPWGPGNPNAPYTLFDSRIAPLIPYALRGAIWYQGESNSSEPEHYQRLLTGMIRDWRRAWGQGDFPFLQVQLANYANTPPNERGRWAALRDAQLRTLAEPATGMAVAIDIGESGDIHPPDKRSVGQRLARWALATTYGRGGVPSGPLYADAGVEPGGRMRIRFTHGSGLRTRDGRPPCQVLIAGLDRAFVPAETAIIGDTLVAWHPRILRPAAVRYAWADDPVGCNLEGGNGLPASPFRTDAW